MPVAAIRDVAARDAKAADARERGVTPRVAVLCLGLAAFFGYVIPVVDYKFSNTFLGATHLAPGAVAVLLALVLVVNPLLRLLRASWKFGRNEVLTVYLSCLFSCLVPGIGGNNYFVSFIIGSFYYATRENRWFDSLKGLPPWMTPALNADGTYNRSLVEGWYSGLRPGDSIPWGAWIVPLLAWGAFAFATFWMLACLSVMLRAQWGEREALAFPLLRLPLEITEDVDRADKYGTLGRFFRNPMMWAGFAVAVFVQSLNGLQLYFPDVPRVPLEINTGPLFTEAPWNQMGWVPMRVWPIAVGMTYLLTAEVSFSLWFFFWFIKLQLIGAYFLGFPPNSLPNAIDSGGKIFTVFQDAGAHITYVAIILWMAREHLTRIVRRAFGRARPDEQERREALPYPVAFWGFVLSFCFMLAWSWAAGMALSLALAQWASYLVIAIVVSRVVAAGGLIFVHHTWMPLGVMGQLVGTGPGTWLSPANGIASAAVLEAGFIQDYRASLLPSFVQSFKLAHDRGINARALITLIFGVIIVSMLIGLQMNVRLGYENSGLSLQGWLRTSGPQTAGNNAHIFSQSAPDVSWTNWLWLGLGGLIIGGITLARSRFLWFPLHPLGYLMCQTYPIHTLWFSILIGWACKVLITRFGGHETYRKTTPAFLGLALGDVAMMLVWIVVDGWQGRHGHQLMPG